MCSGFTLPTQKSVCVTTPTWYQALESVWNNRKCQVLLCTDRIRWGKVMFSVCLHLMGGEPGPDGGGGTSARSRWGVPPSLDGGGNPIQVWWGEVPQPGPRGVPPSLDGWVPQPGPMGVHWPGQDRGYPRDRGYPSQGGTHQPGQDRGTPARGYPPGRDGAPPPPPLARSGRVHSPRDWTAHGVSDKRRSVCLLRSGRRTFFYVYMHVPLLDHGVFLRFPCQNNVMLEVPSKIKQKTWT